MASPHDSATLPIAASASDSYPHDQEAPPPPAATTHTQPTLAARRAQAGRVLRPLASLLPNSRSNSTGSTGTNTTSISSSSSSSYTHHPTAPAPAPIPRITAESSAPSRNQSPRGSSAQVYEPDPRFIHDIDEPRTNPLISPLFTPDGEWPRGSYFPGLGGGPGAADSSALHAAEIDGHHLTAAQRWRLRRRRAAQAANLAKHQQQLERDRALVASRPSDFGLGLGLMTSDDANQQGPSVAGRQNQGHHHHSQGLFASAWAFWRSRDVDSRPATPVKTGPSRPRAVTSVEPIRSRPPMPIRSTIANDMTQRPLTHTPSTSDTLVSSGDVIHITGVKPAPLVLDSLAPASDSSSALFPTVLPPPPRRHRHTRSDGSILSIAPSAPPDASLAMSFVEAVALPQTPVELESERGQSGEGDARDSSGSMNDRSGRSSRRSTISDRSSPASRFGFSRIDEDLTRSPSPQALKKLHVENASDSRACNTESWESAAKPKLPHRLSAFDDALHTSPTEMTMATTTTTPPTPAGRSCAMSELQAILQQEQQHADLQQQASQGSLIPGSPLFPASSRRGSSGSRSRWQHSDNIPVPLANRRPVELAASLAPTPQSSDPYAQTEFHADSRDSQDDTSSSSRACAALGQPSPRFGAPTPFPSGPLNIDVTSSTKALISELDLESLFGSGGPANRRKMEAAPEPPSHPSVGNIGIALTTSRAVLAQAVTPPEETSAAPLQTYLSDDDEEHLDPTAPDHMLTVQQASLHQEHVLGSTERLAEVCYSRRSTGTFGQSVTSDVNPRLASQQRSSSSGAIGEHWDAMRGRRRHVVAEPRPIKAAAAAGDHSTERCKARRKASVAVDAEGSAIRASRRGSAKDKHDSWWLEGGPLDADVEAAATQTGNERQAAPIDAREITIKANGPSPSEVSSTQLLQHKESRHSIAAAFQRFKFDRRRSSRSGEGLGPRELVEVGRGRSRVPSKTATPERAPSLSSSRRSSVVQGIVRRPAELVRRSTVQGTVVSGGMGKVGGTLGSTAGMHSHGHRRGSGHGHLATTSTDTAATAATTTSSNGGGTGTVRSKLKGAFHAHVHAPHGRSADRPRTSAPVEPLSTLALNGGGSSSSLATAPSHGMETLVEGQQAKLERSFPSAASSSVAGVVAGAAGGVGNAGVVGRGAAQHSNKMETTVTTTSARRRFSGFRRASTVGIGGGGESRRGSRDENTG